MYLIYFQHNHMHIKYTFHSNYIFCLFHSFIETPSFFFLAIPSGMEDHNSFTRDVTRAPCIGSMEP